MLTHRFSALVIGLQFEVARLRYFEKNKKNTRGLPTASSGVAKKPRHNFNKYFAPTRGIALFFLLLLQYNLSFEVAMAMILYNNPSTAVPRKLGLYLAWGRVINFRCYIYLYILYYMHNILIYPSVAFFFLSVKVVRSAFVKREGSLGDSVANVVLGNVLVEIL